MWRALLVSVSLGLAPAAAAGAQDRELSDDGHDFEALLAPNHPAGARVIPPEQDRQRRPHYFVPRRASFRVELYRASDEL